MYMHTEAETTYMVIIVIWTKIQTSKGGNWVLSSDMVFVSFFFFKYKKQKFGFNIHIYEELTDMFTWYLGSAQHRHFLSIIHVPAEVGYAIKTQFGWVPMACIFWRRLPTKPWEAVVQHTLNFGNTLGV